MPAPDDRIELHPKIMDGSILIGPPKLTASPAPPAGPDLPATGLPEPGRGRGRHGRKHWQPWHYIAVVVGVITIGPLAGIGVIALLQGWQAPPAATAAHSPSPSPSPKPRPSYDLGGYRSAITGNARQTFASALAKVQADSKAVDFSSAGVDAPKLADAARAWLRELRATNPPPAARAGKLAYINAATLGRRAAWAIHNALVSSNLGLYQHGADLANRASSALSRAPGAPSGGGPSGS